MIARPDIRSRNLWPARAAAAGLLFAAGITHAVAPSSFAESRGYQNCVHAAGSEASMVAVQSDYFIYDHAGARRYYLNGYAFLDGRSQPVKIACETTRKGHRVLSLALDSGRYAARGAGASAIASK